MKIAVIGNCQSSPLVNMLSSLLGDKVELTCVSVNRISDNDEKKIESIIKESSIIITHFIHKTFRHRFVQTNHIVENYNNKIVIKIPNLYFKGYNPDLAYITHNNIRIQSPLGDYHHKIIHHLWCKGYDSIQSKNILQSPYLNEEIAGMYVSPESSLDVLKKRETELDVQISDFIEENWQTSRLFFTFNHPTARLLMVLAVRIVKIIKLKIGARPEAYLFGEPLNKVIPISYSGYKEKFQVTINMPTFCRGQKIVFQKEKFNLTNIPKIYSLEKLIEITFRMYELQIHSVNAEELKFS